VDRKYFLPPGSREIIGEKAGSLWNLEKKLAAIFEDSGLRRIYPPLLEYHQVFTRGIGPEKEKKTYKLIDPSSGSLLVLRSDITPQIVRTWWSLGYPEDFSVYYFERVVRIEDQYSGEERELFQGGVELLNLSADPETKLLTLLYEILTALNLPSPVIVIGSSEITDLLSESYPEITPCLKRRDISCVEKHATDEFLKQLLINPVDEINGGIPGKLADKVEELFKVSEEIRRKNGFTVKIDPLLFPPSSYYSGIIFKVICDDGSEVIVGGRYDGLLERFGKRAPAAGFAIDLITVASIL